MDGQGLSILVLKSRLSEQNHFNTKSSTLFFLPRRRDQGDGSEYVGMLTLRTVLSQEAELISKDPTVFRVPVDAVTAMQRVSTLGFRPLTACVEPAAIDTAMGMHVWTMASSGAAPNETQLDSSSAVLHALAAQHQRLSSQAKFKESAAALINSNVTSAELPHEDGNLSAVDEGTVAGNNADRNAFVASVTAEALRSQHRRLFPNVDGLQQQTCSPGVTLIDEGDNQQHYDESSGRFGASDDVHQHAFSVDDEEYENEGVEGDDEQQQRDIGSVRNTLSFNNGMGSHHLVSKSTSSLTAAALHRSAQLSMSYRYPHHHPHNNTLPKTFLNGISRGGGSGKRRGRPPLPRDSFGQIVRPPPRPRLINKQQPQSQPINGDGYGVNEAAEDDKEKITAIIRQQQQHAPTGSATQIADATGVPPQTFIKRSRGRPRKDGSSSPRKPVISRIAAEGAEFAPTRLFIPASSSTTTVATTGDGGSSLAANLSAAPSTAAVSTNDLTS